MSRTVIQNRSLIQQRPSSATVLVVDDEPATIRLMLEILARKGIGAQLAGDGRSALDALDRSHCDLAFVKIGRAHV